MNTGIQDAANLAWKLALVLRGGAGDSLLDSYERERRAVAQDVVATTRRLTRLATVRSPVARRVLNIVLAIVGRLGRLLRRLAWSLAELDIAYDDGWRADPATAVERWPVRHGHEATEPDPALRLLVPEGREARVIADVARFPGLPVRLVAGAGLSETVLVRPDGYVAGRAAPGATLARALGPLARVPRSRAG